MAAKRKTSYGVLRRGLQRIASNRPLTSDLGAGNWFGYEVDDAPLHNLTASQLPPTTIALTIFGAIGQFVELDYRLKFTGTGTASNGFNEGDNGSGTFAGSFGHTLAWGRTDSVNDCEDRRADRGHFVYVHFRL